MRIAATIFFLPTVCAVFVCKQETCDATGCSSFGGIDYDIGPTSTSIVYNPSDTTLQSCTNCIETNAPCIRKPFPPLVALNPIATIYITDIEFLNNFDEASGTVDIDGVANGPACPITPDMFLIPTAVSITLTQTNVAGTLPRTVTQNGLQFYDMPNLTYLDLSENRLVGTLPSIMHRMTALTHLSVSDNFFKGAIPSEFGLLTNLRTLDLSGNRFTSIPNEISLLTNLEYLIVDDNSVMFGNMGPLLAGLVNLKEYNFDKTNIRGLPPDLSNHMQLKTYEWLNKLSFEQDAHYISRLPVRATSFSYGVTSNYEDGYEVRARYVYIYPQDCTSAQTSSGNSLGYSCAMWMQVTVVDPNELSLEILFGWEPTNSEQPAGTQPFKNTTTVYKNGESAEAEIIGWTQQKPVGYNKFPWTYMSDGNLDITSLDVGIKIDLGAEYELKKVEIRSAEVADGNVVEYNKAAVLLSQVVSANVYAQQEGSTKSVVLHNWRLTTNIPADFIYPQNTTDELTRVQGLFGSAITPYETAASLSGNSDINQRPAFLDNFDNNMDELTSLQKLNLQNVVFSISTKTLGRFTLLEELTLLNTGVYGDITHLQSLTALKSLNVQNSLVSGDARALCKKLGTTACNVASLLTNPNVFDRNKLAGTDEECDDTCPHACKTCLASENTYGVMNLINLIDGGRACNQWCSRWNYCGFTDIFKTTDCHSCA